MRPRSSLILIYITLGSPFPTRHQKNRKRNHKRRKPRIACAFACCCRERVISALTLALQLLWQYHRVLQSFNEVQQKCSMTYNLVSFLHLSFSIVKLQSPLPRTFAHQMERSIVYRSEPPPPPCSKALNPLNHDRIKAHTGAFVLTRACRRVSKQQPIHDNL